MKGIKSFYTGALLIAIIVFCSCFMGQKILLNKIGDSNQSTRVTDTEFGNFLAVQHALYVNDFDNAKKMIDNVNAEFPTVKQTKIMSKFLSGEMPENTESLKDSKELSSRLIYDAYLIQKDDWKNLYARHSKDESMLIAPLRIFSGVQQGKTKEILKYIDSLKTNDSWKSFIRGQIAILNNDTDKAAKEFANVHPDFMNINDYLYLMSFYRENGMDEDMEILHNDFTAKVGGMYVLDYPEIPSWSNYSGYKNNLVFSIIQTISHTQVMIFTDLSLMLLRFTQIISNDENIEAVNYYLGQYYFYNNGDYKKCFDRISKTNPLYLFGRMRIAEKDNNMDAIKKIAHKNPLFIPASNMVITNYIKNGDKKSALRLVNRALSQKNLTDNARIFFLKKRANIYLMFNQPNKAQKDLSAVFEIDDRLLNDILLLQARIWAMQNKNLDDAYSYAMMLVKRNTNDILAWDVVGVIVAKNEGVDAALDLLKKIGEIAVNTSSLYEHLGDLYVKKGDKEKARASYQRAIDLSDDGLVVLPFIQKKLRKLK